jgi:RimJ/RimL family protein N-acetyltransferase
LTRKDSGAVIADKKIHLRWVSNNDLDAYYRWYKDPCVQRFMANRHWDPGRSKDDYRPIFLRNHLLRTSASITFTVCLNEGGIPVGLVNCFKIDRGEGCCELGVVVGERRHQRMGIGTSAVNLAVSYVFDLGLSEVCCNILPENKPSIRLFEKCGFTLLGVALDSDIEFLRYRLRYRSR